MTRKFLLGLKVLEGIKTLIADKTLKAGYCHLNLKPLKNGLRKLEKCYLLKIKLKPDYQILTGDKEPKKV